MGDQALAGEPHATGPGAALPTHGEDGVDLTLIRWMLSLSLEDRLRAGQRLARTALRMRDAVKRT